MIRRFLKIVPVTVVVLGLAVPAIAAPLKLPVLVEDGLPMAGPPVITAAAWMLYDETADVVLASLESTQVRSIASTTKIMTGLLAFERGDMEDLVTISTRAADTGEREIELVAGEQVTLGALVRAAMIHSANDAATAIAEHIGGSVEGFVALMNDRAAELELRQTHFSNPHGLDDPEHYSTARDLLELARVAMAIDEFADVVRSRMVVFPDAPDGTSRIGTTTNLLLGDYDGASGVKTGFTSSALLTFVATAQRDGRRLYAVVLGSDGRRAHFADATALFDYGFEQLQIVGTVSTDTPYVSVQNRVSPGPLVAASNYEALTHLAGQGLISSPPRSLVVLPDPTPPPVVVVNRYPEGAPESLWAAFTFWWDQVVGS
jgi:D-alanyl-D-alanine carboxypeptidase